MHRAGESPLPEHDRVTKPERFAPIVDAARAEIARLVSSYDVAVTQGPGCDDELESRRMVVSVVRLTPARVDAAPLTFAFTPFPGVYMRFGRWHTSAYPPCGCDACDSSVEDLIEQLTADIRSVVDGDFSESLTRGLRPRLSHTFRFGMMSKSIESKIGRPTARRLGRPRRIAWSAWTAHL